MIDAIILKGLLPKVFSSVEAPVRFEDSEVWLTSEFVLCKGCRICVCADSGSGKSSLLSFIYGIRNDYDGEILFDNDNIRAFGVQKWCDVRSNAIALLPQELRLFPELTVMQNLQLKNSITGHKTQDQLLWLLERFGLREKANDCLGMLSIGQQQRVAIIRTVCQPFDFIFLDEPVSHLDKRNNRIAAEIISEEAMSQGAGIVSTSVGNPLLLENAKSITL